MTRIRKWSYHEPRGRPCKLCGLGMSSHRVRHEIGCNCGCSHKGQRSPAERNRGRKERVYWIGLDGEGMGRSPHRYTLLAWSDATGRRYDSIHNPAGLRTGECLEFLLSLPTDARIAGFYLGYDWTMILRDLPNRSIYRLLRPELRYRGSDEGNNFTPVRWRQYSFNCVGRMMRISKRGGRSVTIWDVGNFFQCPFVDAIKKWDVGTPEERELITKMKAKRSAFNARDSKNVAKYCFLECRILASLIRKLDDAHTEAGLKLRSWHGPGSTATVALNIMGIKSKRGIIPDDMRGAVACGFFGGRFEQRLSGEVKGPVYGYDIVSAYPYQAFNLPCLEHGVWEHCTKESELRDARHSLVRFELCDIGKQPWGPLPIRLSNGCILFPRSGASGWCWRDEWQQASAHWEGIRFIEAWALRSDCECQPFKLVLDWFREREKLGKDAKGHTFRLGLNSIYGKLAQSVGRPQFRSLVWAGMITSGCRSQILDLIGPRKHDVLAIATDGIYCRKRIKPPDWPMQPDRLGSWEEKIHESTTFVRPGIYWSEDQVKARGLGKKHLSEQKNLILEALSEGARVAHLGKVEVFGGARACVYQHAGRYRRSPRYGDWTPTPVRVSLDPAPKRMRDWSLFELDGIESAPYRTSIISPQAAELKRRGDVQWSQAG